MAISYPTGLDTTAQPSAGQVVDSARIAKIIQMIEAIEAKCGITGSAVTTTLDYKVNNVAGAVNEATVNGFLAWAFDPAAAAGGTGKQITAVGTLYLSRFVAKASVTATNVVIVVGAAGTTSTCGVGLYSAAGALLKQSAANISTTTTGVKSLALSSTQALVAGTVYYMAVWCALGSGSAPTLLSAPTTGLGGSGDLSSSVGLAIPNLRSAKTNDTAVNLTAPANFGTQTSVDPLIWFAIT